MFANGTQISHLLTGICETTLLWTEVPVFVTTNYPALFNATAYSPYNISTFETVGLLLN